MTISSHPSRVLIDKGSGRRVWASVRDLSWPWILGLALVAAINITTFGPALMVALPGLPYRAALANGLASTASTYVAPGGPAVGIGLSAAMLRGWGFAARSITVAVTLTALWNQFATFGMPLLSFGLL